MILNYNPMFILVFEPKYYFDPCITQNVQLGPFVSVFNPIEVSSKDQSEYICVVQYFNNQNQHSSAILQ